MNDDKKIRILHSVTNVLLGFVILGFILLFAGIFTGCRTAVATGDIIEIGTAGYRAIGQLNQLDRELEKIQLDARDELERAGTGVQDLRATVSRLIEFAYGLLDEVERVRGTIKEFKENNGDLWDITWSNPYLETD